MTRRVLMMCEYGVDFPLWRRRGKVTMIQDRAALRAELGISDELISELAAWQEAWRPLDADFSEADHQEAGTALLERLRAEAAPGFSFRLFRS
ncbi:hypothetical protein [Nocardioides ferulae]|uniref:hypothetical protein n=1 Tax=Nocardioides ferulae TaxID=2340821 RepID=UPI000EB0E79E|nr:hypothetical protein [Nocardioides ferulae]